MGGALAPRSAVTLPLAVLLLLVFLLFGGVMLAGAPFGLASLSFFHASCHLLVSNEFTGLQFLFDPDGIEKDFDSLPGEEWLRLLHFSNGSGGQDVGALVILSGLFVVVAWAALARCQCRSKCIARYQPI